MLRPRRPTSKGHAERTIGYLETSFGPLRTFASLAAHARSFVPGDVVLDPTHGCAVRLAREARDRLADGDVELLSVDLARYDCGLDPGT